MAKLQGERHEFRLVRDVIEIVIDGEVVYSPQRDRERRERQKRVETRRRQNEAPRFGCDCGWKGREDEMDADALIGGDCEIWSNWICPGCGEWKQLEDYERLPSVFELMADSMDEDERREQLPDD